MQEAITWICVDQDLKRYIAWLGHNDFSPNADFRIVLGSLTSLLHRINGDWLPISWSSILGLTSQFKKKKFTWSPRKFSIKGQILLAKR